MTSVERPQTNKQIDEQINKQGQRRAAAGRSRHKGRILLPNAQKDFWKPPFLTLKLLEK